MSDFADALAGVAGVVSADRSMWSARVTVEHEYAEQAGAKAGRIIARVAQQCRLPAWPFDRVEIVAADRLEVELERPNFPELLGATEVAELLGVTRQRIYELRKAERFPLPIVELAAGPIWLRSTILAFEEGWNRRPGRPVASYGRSFGR